MQHVVPVLCFYRSKSTRMPPESPQWVKQIIREVLRFLCKGNCVSTQIERHVMSLHICPHKLLNSCNVLPPMTQFSMHRQKYVIFCHI